MITEYHRPQTLAEALELLTRPDTLPLGGGTWLNSPAYKDETISVVDLQSLGWKHIRKHGHNLEVDACVTLQELAEYAGSPAALVQAIKLDAPLNIRNMATVAGALVACDGRSPFAAMLLALDAKMVVLNERGAENSLSLGEYLPLRRLPGRLVSKIIFPLNIKTAYQQVAKTPADKPLVCAALAQWSGGRTRLALAGFGRSPLLAMDGTEPDGIETAARSAYHEAGDDFASAEYRADVAATLAKRCLELVSATP